MRRFPLIAAVAATVAWSAQAQQTAPPTPTMAPPKPYPAVTIRMPAPFTDDSFAAFRKQLGDVASRKDRAALSKLVVSKGFFWDTGGGDGGDPSKGGIDNLAVAIGLDEKDTYGWDLLGAAASDATLEPLSDRAGVMCAPAGPDFDGKAFDTALKATETDPPDWGFVVSAALEIREKPDERAPVIEKLEPMLIRVLSSDTSPGGAVSPSGQGFLRVVPPSGKVGFVRQESLAPLVFEQLCYLKDSTGWKIAGYYGG